MRCLAFVSLHGPDASDTHGAYEVVGEASNGVEAVICSALGQESKVLEPIKPGAKDFVVKPFQAERVLDALGKALVA